MTTIDWDVLQLEGVQDIAGAAARRLATEYAHTVEYDDALQEAYIVLAKSGPRVRSLVESGDLGFVSHELYRDLVDSVKTEAKRRITHVSYERLREDAG